MEPHAGLEFILRGGGGGGGGRRDRGSKWAVCACVWCRGYRDVGRTQRLCRWCYI